MNDPAAVRNQFIEWQNRIDTATRHLDLQLLETEPAVGEWPPGIVVSHLADWLELSLGCARCATEETQSPQSITDSQQFNEDGAAAASGRSWSENSRRLHNQLELVVGFLSEVRDDEWDTTIAFPWGGEGTLEELLVDMLAHHAEHGAELQQWRETRDAR